MNVQFGFGAGGGVKYDPAGKQPGYSACQGSDFRFGAGVYAQGDVNVGPFFVGGKAQAGRTYSDSGSEPYADVYTPRLGAKGPYGFGWGYHAGGQFTFAGGGKSK